MFLDRDGRREQGGSSMSTKRRVAPITAVLLTAGLAFATVGLLAGTALSDPGNGHAYGVSADNTSANNGNGHQTVGTAGTSGDPTAVQPLSTADLNLVGANVSGPYDSTRDGSPSANGNGDGNAYGKPCAGCVGKADNKNPPGQLPGPSDLNAGYECDTNSGIAKTNPAHTGCVAAELIVQTAPASAAKAEAAAALAFTGRNVGVLVAFALTTILLGLGAVGFSKRNRPSVVEL
jgi:hypothetical protein